MDIWDFGIGVPLGVLTALIIATYYYYKNAFQFWQSRGLKGPKPYPLVGNYVRLVTDREAPRAWARDFGKVFGVYEGSKPVLVVSDPEIMNQMCVKDFNKFPNHPDAEFNSELGQAFILVAKDDHWRRVRSILSPTFTSGKMRRMFKLIDVCGDDLVEAMHERIKSEPVVHLKDLFGLYTMDAIASCCYGIRLLGYKKEASLTTASNRDEFVRSAMKLFDLKLWRLLLMTTLHEKILKRLGIGFISRSDELAFAMRVNQIIKRRSESGKHFDDYLQTLIDSKLAPADESRPDDEDTLEKHHTGTTILNQEFNANETKKFGDDGNKILSDIEILSGATFLLVVGLETTSTLLTSCFYVLSFHQTIQEKLYQTIKSLARIDEQNKVSFDYDSLTSCQYLDAVISETLRTYPPVLLNDRIASESYHLKSYNLHIPKETKVMFALSAMMRDPDYWQDPDVFDPERFMPEQQHKIVPNSYCPFGIGPRFCLGMRFSLTESKLALAKLLMEFKFEPAPETSYPPEMKINFGLGNIKRPEVRVIRREDGTIFT